MMAGDTRGDSVPDRFSGYSYRVVYEGLRPSCRLEYSVRVRVNHNPELLIDTDTARL